MMYGMTRAEMRQIDAHIDRPQDGLTPLEARWIRNMAAAGVIPAVRAVEAALVRGGKTRREARDIVAQLRAHGPEGAPEEAEALTNLKNFLKGLQ